MVEEMYLEEVKEQEQQNSTEKPSKSANDDSDKSKDKSPGPTTTDITAEHQHHHHHHQHHHQNQNHYSSAGAGFSLVGPSELDGIAQGSPKKPRCDGDIKPGRDGRDGYAFMGGQANFVGGFGQYPIGEIEHFAPPQRFSGNNGVSLTLGLPHHSQSFVPSQGIHMGEARHEFISAMNSSPHPHSSSGAGSFDGINIPNPKRFAAQLLPDFVS